MPYKDPEKRRANGRKKYYRHKAEGKILKYKKSEKYKQTSRVWRKKNRISIIERKRRWYANLKRENPEKWRAIKRRETLAIYGLTPLEFEKIIKAQGGGCAICKIPFRELPTKKQHIDHDHETGIVRGILCAQCNWILGLCCESIEILGAAVDYLIKSKEATR